MSTGPEHYIEAERLLALAPSPDFDEPATTYILRKAQVHMTAALVAAQIDAATGARVESWQHAFVGNRDQL
jgi:hypothetical protein